MRIWVSTENSRGPEIRPDGGRRDTSSFHAGFRLTEEGAGWRVFRKIKAWDITCWKIPIIYVTFPVLTGKDNEEDDGNVNEEELEVSKVTKNLREKKNQIRDYQVKKSTSLFTVFLINSTGSN